MSITPPPYMTTTSADIGFVGYFFSSDGEVIINTCPQNSTWSTWTGANVAYGQCCQTTTTESCNFPTICFDYSRFENRENITESCGNDWSCLPQTVFAQFPTGSPTIRIICVDAGYTTNSLYRAFPTMTASASSTSLPSSNPGTTTLPLNKSDNAWIAGAVVGPVLMVFILALLLLLWLLQRKLRASKQQVQTFGDEIKHSEMRSKINGNGDDDLGIRELATSSKAIELPSRAQEDAQELPGDMSRS